MTRLEGPSPEREIARDMIKRALWVAPGAIVLFGIIWGVGGALSTAYAIGIVVVNFALAAALLAWTARISLSMMMAAALFGFLIRLALIFAAFWIVRDASWLQVVPFAVTLVVTHLGLLFWETRYVSANLAFPGLQPGPADPAAHPPAHKES